MICISRLTRPVCVNNKNEKENSFKNVVDIPRIVQEIVLFLHLIAVRLMGPTPVPPFHLAFPVNDIDIARDFYIKYVICKQNGANLIVLMAF